MIKKEHKILAAVLVAQIVLSVVVFWPRPSTAGQREPLFPDLEAEDVTGLRIEDAQGNVVALERVTGDWVLAETDQYPAKADTVSEFLEKLTALTTGQLVTESDTSHKRLQVAPDDFVRRVMFATDGGIQETLYLGSSPRYGSMHFRLEGQSETYLTSELTTWDVNATASTWIDTSYQSVAQDDVTKIRLENANGTFVFEKEGEDTWEIVDPPLEEGETLDQAQVKAVLRRAASVTMNKPLGKEEQDAYGMDEPNAVVTLETADKTVTLRIGSEDADDASYVAKSSESDYYVHVAATSVKALVDNGYDAFLMEPTPEAESSDS